MAGEIQLTVVGTLTADPEVRFTQSGAAVCSFTVANNPRFFNKQSGKWEQGEATFLRCNAWRQLAENISETLRKGHQVVVLGRLQQRNYETQQGDKRTVMELTVEAIGPSLQFATAQVRKVTREGDGAPSFGGQQQPARDPWQIDRPASSGGGGGWSDEPPFHHPRLWDEQYNG